MKFRYLLFLFGAFAVLPIGITDVQAERKKSFLGKIIQNTKDAVDAAKKDIINYNTFVVQIRFTNNTDKNAIAWLDTASWNGPGNVKIGGKRVDLGIIPAYEERLLMGEITAPIGLRSATLYVRKDDGNISQMLVSVSDDNILTYAIK